MVRRTGLCLLLVVAAGCGSNSGSPSSTTATTTTTLSLTGTVTDGLTGKTISTATLSIGDSVNAGKVTVTDNSGAFSFSGLQQAGFTVTASAPGYQSQAKGVTFTSSQTVAFQLIPTLANVAGSYVGNLTYTQTTGPGNQTFQMILTQNGATVTGTWTTTSAPTRSGNISGNVVGLSFSGTFTYLDFAANGTTACTGNFAVSGSGGGNSVTWTSPGVVENCTNQPTNLTLSAVRQ